MTAHFTFSAVVLLLTVHVLSDRFHEIQPQTGLKMLPPGPSSRKIVSTVPKSVPYPVLQENTLVLSNFLVVAKRNGKLSLMFRQVPQNDTDTRCHSSASYCCAAIIMTYWVYVGCT